MLRQMMKAALAQAERRPDELKEAMEKLGHEPPSGRQLLALRIMGLVAPPATASRAVRIRGMVLLLLLVVALVALGFGLVELVSLPFGGLDALWSVLLGMLVVMLALGVLALYSRRKQARAGAARAGGG